jgi:hypothetical protein
MMTEQRWSGSAELEILRAGFRSEVMVELFTKPTPPGKVRGWGGTFRAEPLLVPAVGRGVVTLPDGDQLEVMVESFDAVTGRGTFFGLGAPPRVLLVAEAR